MMQNENEFYKKIISNFCDTIAFENSRPLYEFIEELVNKYDDKNFANASELKNKYEKGILYTGIKEFINFQQNESLSNHNIFNKFIENKQEITLFNIFDIENDNANNHNKINTDKLTKLIIYFILVRYYEKLVDNEHLSIDERIIDRSDIDLIVESIRSILSIDVCHIVSVNEGSTTILASSNERYYCIDNNKKETEQKETTENIENFESENAKLEAFSNLVSHGIKPISNENRYKNISTLEELINYEYRDDKKNWQLLDKTIFYNRIEYSNLEDELDVLTIRLSPNNIEKNVYLVVLLNSNDIYEKHEIKQKVANIIFLKSKLWRIIDYCYENLYNSHMHYDYIDKISDDFFAYHISDIHADSSHLNSQKKVVAEYNVAEKNKPDLLFITGDICMAAKSAHEFEDNYHASAVLIKAFVVKFWGVHVENEEGEKIFLRSDWKKRIVFCPGNHDYASMNELKTQSSQRETTGGGLNHIPGSTASKFTYYIHALRKYFDVADEHIDEKLNYVRYYPKIGVIVCSLNSCSEENSFLQNKAHIDYDQAKKMSGKINFYLQNIVKNSDSYYTVIMSHHSPNYKPNYFMDKYKKYDANKDEKPNYDSFIANFLSILIFLRYRENLSLTEEFKKVIFDYFESSYDLKEVKISECFNQLSDNTIMKRISELRQYIEANIGKDKIYCFHDIVELISDNLYYIKPDESFGKLMEQSKFILRLSRICTDIEESIADSKALNQIFKLFENKLWLSGHVHENAKFYNENNIYEAENFIYNKSELSINIIKKSNGKLEVKRISKAFDK